MQRKDTIPNIGKEPFTHLALHGWGSDHRTFDPISSFVPSKFSVLCPDLPGYGSTQSPKEWTLDCVTEETVSMIKTERIQEPIVIIGNCLGAVLGLEMIVRNMINAKKIIIIDPVIFFPMYLKIFLLGKLGKTAYLGTLDTKIGRFLSNLAVSRNKSSDIDYTESFKDVNHDSAYKYLNMMAKIPDPSRYKEVNIDVDIIYGQKTLCAVRKSSKALREIWNHANEIQVPNAGHLPLAEQSEVMANLIFDT